MVLFSGKIKCLNCQGNFKGKKQRGKRIYICTNYDKFGKCVRETMKQDFILELLDKRFDRRLNDTEIDELVELIEVKKSDVFTIHIKNEKPIIFEESFIHF